MALAVTLMLATTGCMHGGGLPLFDAHIHYNHDTWDKVPPQEAIALLRKAGAVRALVSSSSDEGTQKLYAEAPDLIVPELRPYRKNGETATWVHDESVIAHVEQRLTQYRYVALGEFHVKGADADLPVVHRMVQLAKQHGLMLHAHADADAIERLFRQDPEARIVWAHAGFEPPARVRELLRRYAHLWAELSSRGDLAPEGHLAAEWRELLLEFPDRFMVGTDTGAPSRWLGMSSVATATRTWLAELPVEVAERIAYKNGEALLTARFSTLPPTAK
ncbi:MAG: amidohydrolase [Nitrospirae bacterium]|nr:amidohydrolase [Nitrospirota bacterium]